MIVTHEVGPTTPELVRHAVMRQVFPERPPVQLREPDAVDQLFALETIHAPAARAVIWWSMVRDNVPRDVVLAHVRALVFSLRSVTV